MSTKKGTGPDFAANKVNQTRKMADNDGFAMEEIQERHSVNSFSSINSTPKLKREQQDTWDNGGEKPPTSINMSSTMVKR